MNLFSNKKYRVNRSNKENIDPNEIFLDKMAKKREKEFDISEKRFEIPLGKKINYILASIITIIIVVLFGTTFYFQVIKGNTYSALSFENKTSIHLKTPKRGVIYDKDLNQLVYNSPSFDLVCDKRELFYSPFEGVKKIEEISKILGQDLSETKNQIKQSNQAKVLITENLSHKQLILLETKINNFPGCKIKKGTIRNYSYPAKLSHLLGFTGRINKEELQNYNNYSITDYIGKTGVEKYYENVLRGNPGKIKIEKDALGKIKDEEILSSSEPGKSLILNLNINLQKKLTEELGKSISNLNAKKGAAIALNPQNGAVLSMVSLPFFNSNTITQGPSKEELDKINQNSSQPFFNRVISGRYSSGSTIKPIIATAALEKDIISPSEKLYCPLELCLYNKYSQQKECFYDWKYHGWADIKRAIAESINPFFYIVGGGYTRPQSGDSRLPKNFEGLGVENIKKWLLEFGWGQKTNIDLPWETKGRIPDPQWRENYFEDPSQKTWQIGNTYHLSIGQGDIATTPIQVAASFSAIANGGTLYQPQVVDKIIRLPTGSISATSTPPAIFNSQKNNSLPRSIKVIKEIEPNIIQPNIANPKNIKVVKEGMKQAVESGSAVVLSSLPVTSAAKTGTAETGIEEHYHHWVTVFAPYENPEIVLTILIEGVEGLQSATLPVAKNILEWYFSRTQN